MGQKNDSESSHWLLPYSQKNKISIIVIILERVKLTILTDGRGLNTQRLICVQSPGWTFH